MLTIARKINLRRQKATCSSGKCTGASKGWWSLCNLAKPQVVS